MSSNPKTLLSLGGTSVEKVENCTYLGRHISFSRGMEKEIEVRKDKAWKSYWVLKRVFKEDMSC